MDAPVAKLHDAQAIQLPSNSLFYCINKFLSLSSFSMNERLDKFEKMLNDIQNSYSKEKTEIDRLKSEGKEKRCCT